MRNRGVSLVFFPGATICENWEFREQSAMREKIICYCFGHTEADIVRDVLAHGRSTILEAIIAAKKAGGCRCATENPKGR
jgi:hypothetical protein